MKAEIRRAGCSASGPCETGRDRTQLPHARRTLGRRTYVHRWLMVKIMVLPASCTTASDEAMLEALWDRISFKRSSGSSTTCATTLPTAESKEGREVFEYQLESTATGVSRTSASSSRHPGGHQRDKNPCLHGHAGRAAPPRTTTDSRGACAAGSSPPDQPGSRSIDLQLIAEGGGAGIFHAGASRTSVTTDDPLLLRIAARLPH